MRSLLTIWFSCIGFFLQAQDSITHIHHFNYQGYVKNMQTLSFAKGMHEMVSSNLLHNRINLKWIPSNAMTIVSEFRNRFLWGEQVRLLPNVTSYMKNEREWFDLQKVWLRQNNYVLHTNIERLYMDVKRNRWSMRLGRQRINWGIGTTWNPNDLFNAFSFLDVDYEERPGADAAKLNYQISDFSDISLAHSRTRMYGSITALRYFMNAEGYDVQMIAARYLNRPTLGLGWAGSIKETGWKGEVQYFFKHDTSAAILNLSMELDHAFEKGWYVKGGMLFNERGSNHAINDFTRFDFKVRPEMLMPSRWNGILGLQKEIDPLSSFAMSVVFAPGMNLLILLPSYQYNLTTNLDLSVFGQSYFASSGGSFQGLQHVGMLRLRWSF